MAGYLLDTNVISETRKSRADSGVVGTSDAERVMAMVRYSISIHLAPPAGRGRIAKQSG